MNKKDIICGIIMLIAVISIIGLCVLAGHIESERVNNNGIQPDKEYTAIQAKDFPKDTVMHGHLYKLHVKYSVEHVNQVYVYQHNWDKCSEMSGTVCSLTKDIAE